MVRGHVMKSLSSICIIIFLLTLSIAQGFAASSAVMQVSATIRPWVSFSAVQNMHSYRVTAADLKRGYVELVGVITVEIKTNIERDIPVRFTSGAGEKILFRESTGGAFFENECRLLPDRLVPIQVTLKKIDSRIMLTSNSREGEYPLNVFMTPEI